MELHAGDLVQTEAGVTGRIAFITRLTAYIDVQEEQNSVSMPILLSELKLVDHPQIERS
jgi:hypothetical protein